MNETERVAELESALEEALPWLGHMTRRGRPGDLECAGPDGGCPKCAVERALHLESTADREPA